MSDTSGITRSDISPFSEQASVKMVAPKMARKSIPGLEAPIPSTSAPAHHIIVALFEIDTDARHF